MPPRARPPGPLTWEELRQQLDYDTKMGWLTWKMAKPRIHVGRRAGSFRLKGEHRDITICGQNWIEHRLIWFWMTGKDPGDAYVDHKNRRRTDNRWENLRLANHSQNYVNSKHFGPSRGIRKNKEGEYRVRISLNHVERSKNVRTYLAAKRLRNKWERELYGEFSCTQR